MSASLSVVKMKVFRYTFKTKHVLQIQTKCCLWDFEGSRARTKTRGIFSNKAELRNYMWLKCSFPFKPTELDVMWQKEGDEQPKSQ